MPHCHLVQVCDYVYGDRSLPARAVPGDGAIPVKRMIEWILEPDIRARSISSSSDPASTTRDISTAVRRAAANVGEMLQSLAHDSQEMRWHSETVATMTLCARPGSCSASACRPQATGSSRTIIPPTPLHRADAFRFLTQNLGQAFDLALETKDTRYPVMHAFCHAVLQARRRLRRLRLSAGLDRRQLGLQDQRQQGHGAILELHRPGSAAGEAAGYELAEACTSPSATFPRRTCSDISWRRNGTEASSSTSAARGEGRTGCRRPRARASCFCARASTAGASCRRVCASSASA